MTVQAPRGRMRRDTRAILGVAAPVFLLGVLCWLMVAWRGGLTQHGPSTTIGWICLMVGLGCVPTGSLFLLLGIGKYFEDRRRTS